VIPAPGARHSGNLQALEPGSRDTARVNANDAPVNLLYAVLGLLVIGFGVAIVIFETGQTRHALATRTGLMLGGAAIVVLGGIVTLSQVVALFV
jgi:hypothetical protein